MAPSFAMVTTVASEETESQLHISKWSNLLRKMIALSLLFVFEVSGIQPAGASTTSVTVTGTVFSPTGTPLPGVHVSARVQQSGIELGSAKTNANGNYSLVLSPVEIGSTVLLGLGGRDEGWLEQNAAGSVSIGSSGTVVINLTEIAPSLSTVQGRVTQINGDPISGLSVWVISPSSFSIEAVTDADGNYSATLTNVTPGTQFYVAAGGPSATWPFSLQWVSAPSFNRTAIVNIVLSPFLSTRLTVVVNDTNHHLVSGALVSLALSGSFAFILTNNPYLASTCTTNASGTCLLDAPSDFGSQITQGNLTLTVSASLGGAVIGTALWDGSRKSQFIDAGIITSTSVPAGTLSVVSTVGKAITRLSVSQSVATLPSGVTTALGAISYVITGLDIGASTNVSFYLPSSSSGTNGLFKQIGGTWVDLAPYCTFDGQRVTLSVTDGGVLDADGLANGIVVDPVVPVRIASKALFRLALSTAGSAVKRGARVSIKVSFANFQHPGTTAVKLYDNGILLGTVSVKAGSGVWSGSLQKVGMRTITASISARGFPTVVSSMARITVSK